MKKVLVIGSLNMDIVLEIDQMPVSGETIIGSSLRYSPGGKGANQAYAVGRLGGSVIMLGCVGSDNFGKELVGNLREEGVDISRIKYQADIPTGTAVITVDKYGANSIIVIPGANSACKEDYLRENDDAFRQCDYILLQMEIPPETVWYAVRRGRELGKKVFLNPAPAPDTIPADVLSSLSYITPNETEIAKLTGCGCDVLTDIKEGSKKMIEMGVENILVTLGGKGSLLLSSQKTEAFPAFPVKPVDTTAAGDCFNAAFVTALSEGSSEGEAISFASAAAGLAVSRKGAQNSIPHRQEVDDYLRKVDLSSENNMYAL